MEIKIGDVYIRHSDGQICKVKWTDRRTVVLELGDERHLSLTKLDNFEKTVAACIVVSFILAVVFMALGFQE